MSATDRPYDIVLFGATGFAGRLTAEHLAAAAPDSLRWALAGRSRDRLEAVRASLAEQHPGLQELPLLVADVDDAASVRAVAEQTRVLVTTVGPYAIHGDAAVAACAATGTDYLDLTGEPEFVDRSYARHHRAAVDSGARLIHAAGFDSVPHDLGAYFTVLQLPQDVPLDVSGFVRVSASFSGGTLASLLFALSRPRENAAAHRERRAVEDRRPTERSVHVGGARFGRDPIDGGWALPLPTIDPQIVGRSARALDRYGPSFRYRHHLSVKRLPTALGLPLGLAGLGAVAQVPPLRRAVSARVAPGSGPSEQRRENSWFTVTFVGEGGGRRVTTRVSGGDPGYTETARMLGEAALCLVLDDLPSVSGQVTTAQALGDPYLARLQAAGLGFEVLSTGPA